MTVIRKSLWAKTLQVDLDQPTGLNRFRLFDNFLQNPKRLRLLLQRAEDDFLYEIPVDYIVIDRTSGKESIQVVGQVKMKLSFNTNELICHIVNNTNQVFMKKALYDCLGIKGDFIKVSLTISAYDND